MRPALIVGVDTRACALPLPYVIETMRQLPIEPVAGSPPFVLGVSIIRGAPVPVVDLGVLLGAGTGDASRFVTLRLGDRQVAISVDQVLGVRELETSITQALPPLLQGASHDAIEEIGTLDQQMLVVLRAGWQLPVEALAAIASPEGSQ
ncbi:MAG TPA: chemotaxis protein CheW [Candidatus Angelobacter sp.]